MTANTQTVAELHQHIETLRDQVRTVTLEIKEILRVDLPLFVDRELKSAFINHPDFAQTIDDDLLQDIKKALSSAGATKRDEILAALEDDALWLPSSDPNEDTKTSIDQNNAVWSIVSGICESVHALKVKFNFPDVDGTIQYKAPSWFIERKYLPSLSERYWRLIRELNEAQRQITESHASESKGHLARRWDDA
jgi:hypothetical protein